ncbi:MAG: MAPEG family protein [Pseudomonadota bacterium]
MDSLEAVGLYIAINLVLLVWFGLRVVVRRRGSKTSLGDGGHEDLERAIRVHGNASENIPPILVGLVAVALLSGPVWMVHVLGGQLTLGRIFHAVGLSQGTLIFRQMGMLLTWTCFLLTAAALVHLIFV